MSERVRTVFFDVGGVLLSNGWDREQRAGAVEHFGLNAAELESRHAGVFERLECGELTMDEYLGRVVFYEPRRFPAQAFLEYMRSCSQPLPASLGVLRELASTGRTRLATLNNESRELNEYRVRRFELGRYFSAFCTSCYLGARKPSAEIYRRALGIVDAAPESSVFIDDRAENLAAARAQGMGTIHFITADDLRAELATHGLLG